MTATHTTRITTFSNGAPAKARRAACSCGYLGPRFAFLPFQKETLARATAKAEADAAEHCANHAA